MAPFFMDGVQGSRLEPLRGGSLLFTTKFPEILVLIFSALLAKFLISPVFFFAFRFLQFFRGPSIVIFCLAEFLPYKVKKV